MRSEIVPIAAFWLLTGVLNFAIFVAWLRPFHLAVLAVACFIVGYGLFLLKEWSYYLTIILSFFQANVILLALYLSIVTAGFNPRFDFLVFHIGLIVWALALIASLCYLFRKREFLTK